ncbi:MAG: cysteine desulfurase NifS, cysteine desulfurase [Candidatus Nomurabacteria bacterium]|nr:cysteine desulfurase NifS, cysteine desulfurase [Candidatus Nomurabacteria bacterium]
MGFFKSFSKTTLLPQSNRIYLDFASSTPLDQEMLSSFPKVSTMALQANPSALHKEGLAAKKVLSDARALVAKTLEAHSDEIVFTSNATESDNLALQGTVRALLAQGVEKESIAIVTTDTEHSAVLETVKILGEEISVTVLATEQGIIDPKQIVVDEGIKALVVSVMYVNNEIGVVQPIYEIAKRIRFLLKHNPDAAILLHVDATQAPLHFSLNVQKLGIDMMTLGATKLYCPKGIGMLYVKRGTPIAAIQYGGGQEFGLRPGTEPIQLIHDFAYALSYAQEHVEGYSRDISELQSYAESLIKKDIPSATITAEQIERTPHVTHIALKGFDSELLVLELDARGIAVSAKSACKNEDVNESGVVERIYGEGWGAVRMSYGRNTTKDHVAKAVAALASILEKYRQ